MKRGHLIMTEGSRRSDEAVSALVDGELEAGEADAVIEQLESDAELRRRWARYHACRAALAGSVGSVSADFTERCSRRLAQEPAIVASPVHSTLTRGTQWLWRRPASAGLAAAASLGGIALAAVLAVQLGGLGGGHESAEPGGAPATADAGQWRLDQPPRVAVPALRPDGLAAPMAARDMAASGGAAPTVQQRLDEYVTSHAAFSGSAEMPAVIQSGRLAGHRSGQ